MAYLTKKHENGSGMKPAFVEILKGIAEQYRMLDKGRLYRTKNGSKEIDKNVAAPRIDKYTKTSM